MPRASCWNASGSSGRSGELEKLAVKPGEWAEISNEHSRLSHAASLIEGAQEALTAISEADHPILSQLSALDHKLAKLVDIDAALKPVTRRRWSRRASSCRKRCMR